jgi:penicillin-binding protein 1A
VTTNSWFAGFTPYYTCAIWGGYDDNSDLSSTTFTKNIWNHVMGKIHEGLEDIGFSVPEGIITCTVCQTSGLIANPETCTDLITEYFAEGTEPEEVCDYHETAVICTESGMLAGEYCPETETRVYTKGSDDEENGMPTEVCNIHTEESLLDQILNQFTEWGENLGNAGTNPDASDPETPNSESTPTP